MFKLSHPGKIILEDCIKAEGLSIAEAASKLDVGVHTLTAITEGSAPVTPYVARRLEAAGWSTAESWLRNQRSFDAQT